MPGHTKKTYKVKKAMAGTKTASEERMLAKNMGAPKMPGGGHTKNMPGGGKAPMFMMGGKTYANMGAMIKAEAGSLIDGLANNASTFSQMERVVDKKRNQKKGS